MRASGPLRILRAEPPGRPRQKAEAKGVMKHHCLWKFDMLLFVTLALIEAYHAVLEGEAK
jgi:hypothetical protein